MSIPRLPDGVTLTSPAEGEFASVLTPHAMLFLSELHRTFNARRLGLLQTRKERQTKIDAGESPDFLPQTRRVREDSHWRVAPTPPDLQNRRVEITGPVDRKMVINALNSGADVFMADFEDSNSPTWQNNLRGHINLRDAIARTITFTNPDGKHYHLNEKTATLLVRPRGWHLDEKHFRVDGKSISGSLFDFGLYFFHNAKTLLAKNTGPYFYLPKLESHLEARLWNDVFLFAQDKLGIPRGSVRATVLIETILAAFEMDEILYELAEHSSGLNAGRWDYLFSIIKKFRNQPGFMLPDRAQLTMTVPFMRAYARLLVHTCHKRSAHAMGGMAAFIPSRKDPVVNETALAKVREDKLRESSDGFDGTWVAHPDLVPVAAEIFAKVLGDKPNQKDKPLEDPHVTAAQLQDFTVPGGQITEAGVRNNISVSLQYLESWLRGNGCVPIFNLMEDAATAEISRSQLWLWHHHESAKLPDARRIDAALFRSLVPDELAKIRAAMGDANFNHCQFTAAAQLLDKLVTTKDYTDFLTLPAYDLLH